MAFLRRVAVAATVLFSTVSASAAQLPQLLDSALARGETANAVRWAFTQEATNNRANVRLRFMPEGQSGSWEVLELHGDSLGEDADEALRDMTDLEGDPDPDSDLTYEQLRFAIGDQDVEVLSETDTHITYGFAPLPWDDIEEDEVGLIAHMLAEVTVDRSGEYISTIRMYAPESFSHMLVARINHFEQIMRFEPEPTTGLPLMTYFNQEVRARAVFRNINRNRTETYSDFVPMSRNGAALSCGPETCASEYQIGEFLAAQ